MYKIEKRPSGFLLTFSGAIGKAEMTCWLIDSERQLASAPEPFGVIVDARRLVLMNGDAQALLAEGQTLYRKRGMIRSAVAIGDSMVTRQLKRLAEQSGIDCDQRYIDTHEYFNWSAVAVAWVRDGVDPDVPFMFSPYGSQRRSPGWIQQKRSHGSRFCNPEIRIGAIRSSGASGHSPKPESKGRRETATLRTFPLRFRHCQTSSFWHCTCSSRIR